MKNCAWVGIKNVLLWLTRMCFFYFSDIFHTGKRLALRKKQRAFWVQMKKSSCENVSNVSNAKEISVEWALCGKIAWGGSEGQQLEG